MTAAALMVTAFVALSPVSDAHAETNRRICEYSFKAKPRNWQDPLIRISIGLDYKKNGECPAVNKELLEATGYADEDQIFSNPVEKWECEQWGAKHDLYLSDFHDGDPCPHMTDDHLYAFFWQDRTVPNATKPTVNDMGHWTRYDDE